MNSLKKVILLFALVANFANIGYSQVRDVKVKGVMVDSIRNEVLEFATITLYEKDSEHPMKYALSNSKGEFELAGIKAGEYLLKVEYMGFTSVEKKLTLGQQRVVDLGNLGMLEQINLLDQVVVTDLGNPVIIKKDTIEYSATAFKSTDSDMLEDLLKKLPGIEIDSDGKITAHGKEIDKIMVDGKPFFFNDPNLATKNLPAKIIDKVKVIDRMSEQSRFTGIYDGNEETIIDLTIRPGMMNGWFGNINGGYGTSNRYQAAGMLGNFTENYQLSLIANGNNSNNRAFSDFGGDAMRSMRNSFGGGGGRGGGIRVGGTTFRFGGNGITTSQMGGVNANTQTKNGKFKIGGNYFYGSTDNLSESTTHRQTFLTDSSFISKDSTVSRNFSGDHRVALELEWTISENTSIIFRPNVSIGNGSFSDENKFETDGVLGTPINKGSSHSFGDSYSRGTGGDLHFRQRLGKPGRTFSISVNYNFSERELYGTNQSELNSFKINPNNPDVIITNSQGVDQEYQLHSNSLSMGARASYTEPLGYNYFMELAYRYNHSVNSSDKKAYNFDETTQEYSIEDEEYSNSYTNTFISQVAEINLLKNEEKYNYTVGFNVQPSFTESVGLDAGDIRRSVVNYSPSAMFNYRFSQERSLRLDYRGTTSQPSLTQLQPVPDNSNPLYIPMGNPDLLPQFNHRLYATLRNSNRAAYRSLNFILGGNYYMDRIVNATIYDAEGVRYTIPVNTSGSYSLFSNVMYNTPVGGTKKFNLSSLTRISLNGGVNYNAIRDEGSVDPSLSIDELLADAIKNRTTSLSLTENLRLTYRGEKMESSIGGRASYSYAWYTIEGNIRPATWNNSLFYYMNWTLPGGLNFMTDINYQFYIGYDDDINKPATIWNLELAKLLFKNKATLGVRVYDVLNQARTLYRNINDNFIEDSSNNTLQRYIMVNFIYRFGKFGKDSVSGRTPGMGPGGGRGMYRGMH